MTGFKFACLFEYNALIHRIIASLVSEISCNSKKTGKTFREACYCSGLPSSRLLVLLGNKTLKGFFAILFECIPPSTGGIAILSYNKCKSDSEKPVCTREEMCDVAQWWSVLITAKSGFHTSSYLVFQMIIVAMTELYTQLDTFGIQWFF